MTKNQSVVNNDRFTSQFNQASFPSIHEIERF
jgi:hypothetical protein